MVTFYFNEHIPIVRIINYLRIKIKCIFEWVTFFLNEHISTVRMINYSCNAYNDLGVVTLK